MPPPPPVTPSPHRFVLSKKPRDPAAITNVAPSQPSPLRTSSHISARQQQQFNTTPRFNATPRFKVAHTPSQPQGYAGTYSTPIPRSTTRGEVIEDDEDTREKNEDYEGDDGIVHDSIESADWEQDDEMDIDMDISHAQPLPTVQHRGNRGDNEFPKTPNQVNRHKRRRISIASFSSPSSIPVPGSISNNNAPYVSDDDNNPEVNHPSHYSDPENFEDLLSPSPGPEKDEIDIPSPPPPRRPSSSHAPSNLVNNTADPISPLRPHFILPSTPGRRSKTLDPVTATPATKPPRNRFLPPATPATGSEAAEEQLPDVFSPHRRGRRYVPGGLAAEVAGWLVDYGSNIPQNQHQNQAGNSGQRDERGVRERDRVRVVDVRKGDGMLLVSGRQIHRNGSVDAEGADIGEEMRLILVGRSEGANNEHVVLPGSTVRARGRGWEVELGTGARWVVWVRWEIVAFPQ